jgi:hypothetical protein
VEKTMKTRLVFFKIGIATLFLTLIPTALASTTWYVNGVTGSDSNNCLSAAAACKTIGHAISLSSLGDTIMVAAAIYGENLTIPFGLTINGGRQTGPAVAITSGNVVLSGLTIQGGQNGPGGPCDGQGGGICGATGFALTIVNCLITGNTVISGSGGGIYTTGGSLTINQSTISGNAAATQAGGIFSNGADLQINNSTISGNFAISGSGGGLIWSGSAYITNSTISGNGAAQGGGMFNNEGGRAFISNATISGNMVNAGMPGAAIFADFTTVTMQNSIVANNLGSGNCAGAGTFTSNGYNLSNDNTCNLNGPGDQKHTDPKLHPLRNNGGPTQTMALLNGSPAIDAGNPSGCTDGAGHLLTTDQRGAPRPDPGDSGGCDIGAYERQN